MQCMELSLVSFYKFKHYKIFHPHFKGIIWFMLTTWPDLNNVVWFLMGDFFRLSSWSGGLGRQAHSGALMDKPLGDPRATSPGKILWENSEQFYLM